MKILFATANPFMPQIVGGIEANTLSLSKALRNAGHDVALLCEVIPGGLTWYKYVFNRLLTRSITCSGRYEGVPVFRSTNLKNSIWEVLEKFEPEAIVVQGGKPEAYALAEACLKLKIPVFFYVHDVMSLDSVGSRLDLSRVVWLSNSEFTRNKLHEDLGVDSRVIPPIFIGREYHTQSGDMVTIINPRAAKGGELAAGLAAECPEVKFLFVMGGDRRSEELMSLQAATSVLSNVIWMPPQNDMRAVYRRTRLLIVPSLCLETWGRVVTEAHQSGIPAIVTNAGALPETVGSGGIVMNMKATPKEWAAVVRKLLMNRDEYDRLSQSALTFSLRKSISAEYIVNEFLDSLGASKHEARGFHQGRE